MEPVSHKYQPLVHNVVTRLTIIFRRQPAIMVTDDGDTIRIEDGGGKLATISRNTAMAYRHPMINMPNQATANWNIATHYIGFIYRNKDTIKRCTGVIYPYLLQSEYENVAPICHLLTYLYNHKRYHKLMRGVMRHGNLKFLDRCLAHIIMTPGSNANCVIMIKHPWDLYIDGVNVGKLGNSTEHISAAVSYRLAQLVIQSEQPPGNVDDWSSDSDSAMSDDERFTHQSS